MLLSRICVEACVDFHWKAQSTEQTPFMKGFPSGSHFTAEMTEAMRIKCLSQGCCRGFNRGSMYPETEILPTGPIYYDQYVMTNMPRSLWIW